MRRTMIEKTVNVSEDLNNRLLAISKHRKDQDESGNKVTEIIRECLKAHLPTIEGKMK